MNINTFGLQAVPVAVVLAAIHGVANASPEVVMPIGNAVHVSAEFATSLDKHLSRRAVNQEFMESLSALTSKFLDDDGVRLRDKLAVVAQVDSTSYGYQATNMGYCYNNCYTQCYSNCYGDCNGGC